MAPPEVRFAAQWLINWGTGGLRDGDSITNQDAGGVINVAEVEISRAIQMTFDGVGSDGDAPAAPNELGFIPIGTITLTSINSANLPGSDSVTLFLEAGLDGDSIDPVVLSVPNINFSQNATDRIGLEDPKPFTNPDEPGIYLGSYGDSEYNFRIIGLSTDGINFDDDVSVADGSSFTATLWGQVVATDYVVPTVETPPALHVASGSTVVNVPVTLDQPSDRFVSVDVQTFGRFGVGEEYHTVEFQPGEIFKEVAFRFPVSVESTSFELIFSNPNNAKADSAISRVSVTSASDIDDLIATDTTIGVNDFFQSNIGGAGLNSNGLRDGIVLYLIADSARSYPDLTTGLNATFGTTTEYWDNLASALVVQQSLNDDTIAPLALHIADGFGLAIAATQALTWQAVDDGLGRSAEIVGIDPASQAQYLHSLIRQNALINEHFDPFLIPRANTITASIGNDFDRAPSALANLFFDALPLIEDIEQYTTGAGRVTINNFPLSDVFISQISPLLSPQRQDLETNPEDYTSTVNNLAQFAFEMANLDYLPEDLLTFEATLTATGEFDAAKAWAQQEGPLQVFNATEADRTVEGSIVTPGGLVVGTAGNDVLGNPASPNSQFVLGGDGNDTINGGLVSDIVYGGFGSDTINGGAGDNVLYGGADNDLIVALEGNDQIKGGSGNDELVSGLGANAVDGEEGDDIIHVGQGRDIVWGGDGFDTFLVTVLDAATDYIVDFELGSDRFVIFDGLLPAVGSPAERFAAFVARQDPNGTTMEYRPVDGPIQEIAFLEDVNTIDFIAEFRAQNGIVVDDGLI